MDTRSLIEEMLAGVADMLGYRLAQKVEDRRWSDIFWYTFPKVEDVAAGATATPVIITIQNDSDFEWMASIMHFTIAEAATTMATMSVPNMQVVLTDTGSGKNLMNAQTPVGAVFGNPVYGPIPLIQPKIITRNSVLSATLTNFDAAVATGDIMLTLIGRKIYNADVNL